MVDNHLLLILCLSLASVVLAICAAVLVYFASPSNKKERSMTTLGEAQHECVAALNQLRPLFQSHCQLTLLMRNPQAEDGDCIFSNDDLDDVIKAIERLKEKAPDLS